MDIAIISFGVMTSGVMFLVARHVYQKVQTGQRLAQVYRDYEQVDRDAYYLP